MKIGNLYLQHKSNKGYFHNSDIPLQGTLLTSAIIKVYSKYVQYVKIASQQSFKSLVKIILERRLFERDLDLRRDFRSLRSLSIISVACALTGGGPNIQPEFIEIV